MRNVVIVLIAALCFFSCNRGIKNGDKKSYESTWLQVAETDSGYVVYTYPNFKDNTAAWSPMKIIVTQDSLTWAIFSEAPLTYPLGKVENAENGGFSIKIGNIYKFESSALEKHLAKWQVYEGKDSIYTDYIYVDSLYNHYPIVKYLNNEVITTPFEEGND